MTRLVSSLQKADPAFSFAPNDRIHPGEAGHQVMAYYFLKNLQMPSLVSDVSIDFKTKKIITGSNARISKLKCDHSQISFDLMEQALPYPMEGEMAQATEMVPIMHDLNRQRFNYQRQYRNFVKVNIQLEEKGIPLNDEAQIRRFFIDFPKKEGLSHGSYYTNLFNSYLDIKDKIPEIKAKTEQLYQQIYSVMNFLLITFLLQKL